jgi:hypothetical protein
MVLFMGCYNLDNDDLGSDNLYSFILNDLTVSVGDIKFADIRQL